MANSQVPPLVMFTYPESPVGRRLDWYLTLRGIPYSHCRVDYKMPRPVLARLGVHYRRIPLLAVGRDIYCDSRNIISTLEALYPDMPKLGADPERDPWTHGVEKLMENFAFEGGLFMRTAQLIPSDTPLLNDPKFLEDRHQLTGLRWNREVMAANLPDALSTARMHLDLVENALLKDGRDWLGGGTNPGLADVNIGWAFDWMLKGMKHAYPELLNEQKYPKVFAWTDRLTKAVEERRSKLGAIKQLGDDEAVQNIEESQFWEGEELEFVRWDSTPFKKGDAVDVYATDTPNQFINRDTGALAGLKSDRVTIEAKTKNDVTVRIHYPRINITIKKAESGSRL